MSPSKVEDFLKQSSELLGTLPSEDLKAVKDALEALRKVSPELIDEKVFARFQSLIDTKALVDSLQVKIDASVEALNELKGEHINLQNQVKTLIKGLGETQKAFDVLERRLTFDAESTRQRNEKLGFVLEGLEQYLRRHT